MSEALGMIECRSFPAMVEAADAMVKAAKVELVSYEKTGGGYTTAIVRGDVAAVRAACDAGRTAGARIGDVVAVHVIARPHCRRRCHYSTGSRTRYGEEVMAARSVLL